jgi:centriolar protein POC1
MSCATSASRSAAVNSIDFHPSGDYLLSGSDDSALKIWDLRQGHQLYTIRGEKGAEP